MYYFFSDNVFSPDFSDIDFDIVIIRIFWNSPFLFADSYRPSINF